ncbi:tRNA-specific adenosine deaminase 1 [Prorops nasuta]|uniref:tRNA-specific adenosine deaminase 1 n=1 Tax=Prorops nasuta TaxID=863751 RepID=UPI0034CF4273
MEDKFADDVAKLCIKKYETLAKTGKPINNEWTVLSGFVLKATDGSFSLLSLATGTKCLGGSEILKNKQDDIGAQLSDSHAEVLARRALLRYLYDQLEIALNGKQSDIFYVDDTQQFKIREGISLHFFSSQMPCGDCSIFLKREATVVLSPAKLRKLENNEKYELEARRTSEQDTTIEDIYRTGAKCIGTESNQDPKLPGKNYHVVGPLRIKPGRGNPTLSLSCSDKLAKWNVLGVQGALLSILIPKLKIATIIIGGDTPYCKEAMERGIYKRFNILEGPKVLQASYCFVDKKGCGRTHPCPSSIIWCSVQHRNIETAVNGRKQGATNKRKGQNLLISRRELFYTFLKICDKITKLNKGTMHPKKMGYFHYKQAAINYQKLWKNLKLTNFSSWPTKPIYLQNFFL